MNTMEYGTAFTYPQQDADWLKKWLIMAFVPLIPVVGGFLVLGYMVEIMRRVIKGETPVLPEWTDFGEYLKKGFMGFVVALVYALPVILLAICMYAVQFGIALAAGNADSDSTVRTLGTVTSVISVCFGCLIFLFALALAVLLPAALGRFAATGEMGAGLRLGEVFNLVRAKPGVYIIVALLAGLATSVLMSVGTIIPCCGTLVGAAYGQLAAAHLYGQAYRVATSGTTA
ncbi:MAG TPA: DUF4013 domain-containing protein [Anaerolineales bacterium]|nr:DUF4013 domain-containing protein [Anaerolineales bacterium]